MGRPSMSEPVAAWVCVEPDGTITVTVDRDGGHVASYDLNTISVAEMRKVLSDVWLDRLGIVAPA